MSNDKNIPRIVYLFPSSRDKLIEQVREGQSADTALWGMDHISGAEYFITSEYTGVRSPTLIARLLKYDFVIAQDDLLIGYIVSVCARIFLRETKWIYIAMNSSIVMQRHAAHPIRLFLLKRFWASYYRIICISSKQLEDFSRLGIASEKLVFVPFGIDAEFFKPDDASREEDLVVSVGRDAGRDYATLFKAAEHANYKLIVVASHKNIPTDMSVPASVSVLYDRSYAEIRDLYARARVVVVASKDEKIKEGSDCSGQTAVLDALAMGKSVVATHRSWIADYLVPEEDIVVVSPSNPDALSRAIDDLLFDAEKRRQLVKSGNGKVVARYTTKTFAGALFALMYNGA